MTLYFACVEVRRAKMEDAAGWAHALRRVAEEGHWIATEPPVDEAEAGERVRAWLGADDALWVLDDAGTVRGCLGLHPTAATGVASLGMLVLPEARGRGGGRELLDAALAHARDGDLHKVELEVFVENARAVGLYAGAGFAVEGMRRDHYLRRDGRRHSTLLMAAFV